MEHKSKNLFERFSNWAVKFTGSPHAFLGAMAVVVIWAVSGPFFDYSETWQLVINTGTTIITFLMVFLIQKAQNKDSKAIQIKLNELIAAHEKASNRIVDIEDLTEAELDQLHYYYENLAQFAKKDADIHTSHSIDAAQRNQDYKYEFFKRKHEEWLQKKEQQKKESQ
ncbi:low affinity iron permease family protein [Chryseobacterium artocarpi]|uniref:low affinity iron permease family protein n=1 Tax=Chryseobacterium artocarpi TaxID=1414727 RepID=UPI003F3DD1B4